MNKKMNRKNQLIQFSKKEIEMKIVKKKNKEKKK